ncbi:pyridoxal-phosphate dependent enzyme [Thermoactinomyces sp. CICC 10523]|uniref:threonine synthase n=1 Tax=Thermoactinomyces sp. CICC 10523 TaxID=2767428 RepID=UPI0018DE61B7|nr:pyridoxal-phosphate dependent enzyme [Thermoactinomyces sp. CICC 10523]MBH8599696.1 pyridoxal-phosphate dependent enzyme [Thermoactinomyces sp. CICC 10523]
MKKQRWVWNTQVSECSCIRCGSRYEADEYPTGCPRCLELGYPASMKLEYEGLTEENSSSSCLHKRLPFLDVPTLGEGNTPLIHLERLAEQLGIHRFWVKNEGMNPTGSHKDRMSPLVIARALQLGKSSVVVASSGNAGISLAAYASFAGLQCTVITTKDIHEDVKKSIQAYGAQLVMVSDSFQRWELTRELAENQGFYPATNYMFPPVGSNMYGVQGYKTIAYELVQQLKGCSPSVILVPSSRADLLWGVWEGLKEASASGWIKKLPKMVAVEPFPRLVRVLQGSDYRGEFTGSTSLKSIAGTTVTYQGLLAIRESEGTAVAVSDEEAQMAQKELAAHGLYLELSSAAVLAAAKRLIKINFMSEEDQAVAIGTAQGLKKI